MRATRRFVLALLALAACAPASAQRPIQIVSTGVADRRIPIAVPTFAAAPGLESQAREMAGVVAYDLEFTGLFKVLPPAQYPPGFTGLTADPRRLDFEAWRGAAVEHLAYAFIAEENGRLVAECRLFEALSRQRASAAPIARPQSVMPG